MKKKKKVAFNSPRFPPSQDARQRHKDRGIKFMGRTSSLQHHFKDTTSIHDAQHLNCQIHGSHWGAKTAMKGKDDSTGQDGLKMSRHGSCVNCASCKTLGRQLCSPLQPSVASWPFEQVALDILGPFPETPGKNECILAAGYCSK